MQGDAIRVLLVEDNPDDLFFLRKLLKRSSGPQFQLEHVERLADALARLQGGGIDLILLDLSLTDSFGLETFYRTQERFPEVPVIVLSGLDDEKIALQAVHSGAQDYLVKGKIDSQLLGRAIIYALERTQARVALSKAEEKYRSIFENAVEGIFQTTADGHYLSANPALVRIYGYETPHELIGELTDIERLLYVEPGRRTEFIKEMEAHDVVTDFQSPVYRKDGKIIWISENVRAVRDKLGRLLYYEGTVQDITQAKMVEAKLRNSEALYHSLVETLPQNIFRKDLNERFTFANQRFCATLGRPLEEIIGRTDFDLFPRDLALKYQKDDRLILETARSLEVVEQYQPSEGEVQSVQVVKTPLFGPDDKIVGLQGIFWDITERRRAEDRERKANLELARSQEELRKKNMMMEDDLKMAFEIQQAMLPQQYPSFPKGASTSESLLRFSHRYNPSGTVGGDFFSIVALSDTTAGVFICDVMGHGVRSALVTAMVRALVEELRPVAENPGELLTRINHDLRAILQQTGTPLFTTAFYLVIDLASKTLLYSNAGHPKPFLTHLNGKVDLLLSQHGRPSPALGLFPDSKYQTSRREVAAGDSIILFTDGLYEVESPDGVQYSTEAVMKTIEGHIGLSSPEMFTKILEDVGTFSADRPFDDDVCLVGIDVSPKLA